MLTNFFLHLCYIQPITALLWFKSKASKRRKLRSLWAACHKDSILPRQNFVPVGREVPLEWLEIDQDKLRTKFSALNVDFSSLSPDL